MTAARPRLRLPSRSWLAGGAAIGLALAELLAAALRPPAVHRVEWMAPKLAFFLGAYLLARARWLDSAAISSPANPKATSHSGP